MTTETTPQDAFNGQPETPPSLAPHRLRRDKKRRFSKIPKMPVSVKALWESASAEERTAAHRTCAMILETWLGRTSRPEAAATLGIPPLRLWQQSQRALAGMLAGLVTQPRTRGGVTMVDRANDPKALKARIARLEQELVVATDLIGILRQMPAHRESEAASGSKAAAKSHGKGHRKRSSKAKPARRKTPPTTTSGAGEKKVHRDTAPPAGDARGAGPAAG